VSHNPNIPGFPVVGVPSGTHPATQPYHPVMPDRYAYDPGPYEPNAPMANPTQSVPGPVALENRGYWSDVERAMRFTLSGGALFPAATGLNAPEINGVGAGVPFARALWRSAVFDLRPDLRASASVDYTVAFPINRSAAFGAGGALSCMIGVINGALQDLPLATAQVLELYTVEYGHVLDPTQLAALDTRQNATSTLWAAQTGTALLAFTPPANPIRYWQVALIFDLITVDGAADPPVPTNLSVWGGAQ